MVGYNVEANQPYFDDLYRRAVGLTAMLCQTFSLDPLNRARGGNLSCGGL